MTKRKKNVRKSDTNTTNLMKSRSSKRNGRNLREKVKCMPLQTAALDSKNSPDAPSRSLSTEMSKSVFLKMKTQKVRIMHYEIK